MPTTPSSRLALHAPVGGDPAAVPADMLRFRDEVDQMTLAFAHRTAAERGSAAVAGRLHRATDTFELAYADGTAWRSLGAEAREPVRTVGEPGQPEFSSTNWEAGARPVQFWRWGGVLHLGGIVVWTGIPLQTVTMLQLPDGCRPPVRTFAWATVHAPGGVVEAQLTVETNGIVALSPATTDAPVTLDGISFAIVR